MAVKFRIFPSATIQCGECNEHLTIDQLICKNGHDGNLFNRQKLLCSGCGEEKVIRINILKFPQTPPIHDEYCGKCGLKQI